MHIVLVTDEYHTEAYFAGGMAQAFGKMAHGLAGRGHRVTVLVGADKDESLAEKDGLTVIRYRRRSCAPPRLQKAFAWRLPETMAMYDDGMTLWRQLVELDRREDIDVVLANSSRKNYFAAFAKRWPLVIRSSAFWPFCVACNFEPLFIAGKANFLGVWLAESALARAARGMAPTRITARIHEAMTGRTLDVIRTPMFLLGEPDSWERVASRLGLPERFLLFYGSHQGIKGPHILADALPDVLDRHPDLHMVFVGRDRNAPDGGASMISYLRGKLSAYSARVHFPGTLKQGEAFALIRQSEAVVMPSLLDNLPNTLLESMHFGKIVVATRDSGMDELVVHGQSGILVKRNDAAALAAGIEEALGLPPDRKKDMEKAAREAVDRACNPEKALGELESVLIEARRKHGWLRRHLWLLGLGLAQVLFWVKAYRVWRWGVPDKAIREFHELAERFLPDYDPATGMVRYDPGVLVREPWSAGIQ